MSQGKTCECSRSRFFFHRWSNSDNVFFLLSMGNRIKIRLKAAIIDSPAKMRFHWCAGDGPKLNAGLVAFVIFYAIQTSIAKEHYIL